MQVRSGYAHSRWEGNDLEIHYEDLGNVDDPPVLLIMGLGAQLVLWHDEFCQKLVDLGYRVIRFDNRDVGLSTKLHGRRAGGALIPNLLRSFVGLRSPSVYRLEDMADDAAAVLDHLGIDRAHIVGASMGGMIAQIFAARFPGAHRGAGHHLLLEQLAPAAAAGPQSAAGADQGPASGFSPRGDRREFGTGVQDHRQPGLPEIRRAVTGRRQRDVRPLFLPSGHRPAYQRNPRQRQPQAV